MASGEPIKFRCGRCKQLIGVVRSKAGTVIACPKCGSNLVVPTPDESAPAPPPAAGPEELSSPPETSREPADPLAATLATTPEPDTAPDEVPLEALDIRLEDIQLEPGVRGLYPAERPPRPYRPGMPRPEAPSRPPAEDPSPTDDPPARDEPAPRSEAGPTDEPEAAAESADSPAPFALAPEEPAPATRAARGPAPRSSAAKGRLPFPIPEPEPSPASTVAAEDLPSIAIETDERVGRRARVVETSRTRDLTLPRAVVASWSLLVLLAVGFAFVAGLLAGHYVWRVH